MSQKTQNTTVQRVATVPASMSQASATKATKFSPLPATIDEMVGYSSGVFQTPSYHELLENPHVEHDGLQRLRENLAQLEDLHGRLQFMMRDVSALIRRR